MKNPNILSFFTKMSIKLQDLFLPNQWPQTISVWFLRAVSATTSSV